MSESQAKSSKSTKTISMSLEEYNAELVKAESNGMGYIARLVRDIIRNDGINITDLDKVQNEVTEFLNEVKGAMKVKKEKTEE